MTPIGRKALLLGSGELGKEVAIELQRYGVEVVACDRYANRSVGPLLVRLRQWLPAPLAVPAPLCRLSRLSHPADLGDRQRLYPLFRLVDPVVPCRLCLL